MKYGELVLANFDARIPKIEIRPKHTDTKIIVTSKMYDEQAAENKSVSIIFSHVAAIDFRVNFFDNMIGAEAFGLYRINDPAFLKKLTSEIFGRRKEIYLLEGDYDYDENEPSDMLNMTDLSGDFARGMQDYSVYVQNVDAGVYIIVAKHLMILEK